LLHLLSQILFLAVGALILLGSGFGILWLIPSLRRSLTPIESVIVALLVSSGVAGIWAVAGKLAGIRVLAWAVVLVCASALLLAAGWTVRRGAARRGEARPAAEPAYYRRILLILAALSFVLMLRDGGSLGVMHDSLDFVSFVNESLQTGDLAPTSPIYRATPGIPPDPRRGSFHTEVAAVCALTGTTPTNGWKWLPRLLVPIAILGLGAMLRVWIGTRAASLATVVFVATTFFTPDHFIQNIGYASRFGWVCGWGALLAFGKAVATERRLTDRRARIFLFAIAAASPALLTSVHLLTGFQVLLSLGCAGLAVLCDRASTRGDRKATLALSGAAVVCLLPAFGLRLLGTPKGAVAANPLFDHLYGVLMLAPGWPVFPPTDILARAGMTGVAATLLGMFLLPSIRRNRAAGFLAISTAVPVLILFFPPITRVLLAAHAQSVLFRVVLAIPFAATISWLLLWAIDSLRARPARSRVRAVAVLAFIALAMAGQAAMTRSSWLMGAKSSASYRESEPLLAAYTFLDERFPSVQTILSDPITSYSIPAYTRHDAVAPLDQHSSPSDPTVGDRMKDVQEVLNGRIGLRRSFEVLRRYHVDLVLVNQSFKRYMDGYYVFLSALSYPEQSAKFEGAPQCFEQVYDAEGIRIYRVHDPGPHADLPGDLPNPDRIPDPGTEPLAACGPVALVRAEVGSEDGAWMGRANGAEPAVFPQDHPLPISFVWRCTGPSSALPVQCEVKLQLHDAGSGGFAPMIDRFIGSVFFPLINREFIRFGRAFGPLQTFYPAFLWEPGETYKDVCWVSVPLRARSGTYDAYIRLHARPYLPVVALSDVFSSRLGEDWLRIGEVRIGR